MPAPLPRSRSAPGESGPGPRGSRGISEPSIAAARNAALAAPETPIASVPTGTPRGICTIDSKRIDTTQHLALDRYAQHRQHRDRRQHPRQMGRAAGAGDHHFKSPALGLASVAKESFRRAVRRDDSGLMGNSQVASGPRMHAASSPSRTCCPSRPRPAVLLMFLLPC